MEKVGVLLFSVLQFSNDGNNVSVLRWVTLLHEKLVHLRWEDRDTAIELLKALFLFLGTV